MESLFFRPDADDRHRPRRKRDALAPVVEQGIDRLGHGFWVTIFPRAPGWPRAAASATRPAAPCWRPKGYTKHAHPFHQDIKKILTSKSIFASYWRYNHGLSFGRRRISTHFPPICDPLSRYACTFLLEWVLSQDIVF